MNIITKTNCNNINWQNLMMLLKNAGMGTYTPALHKKAFENSFRVVFLFDNDDLIGCGRLISDGAYQGAIYDIAVDEKYRGLGLGKKIIKELMIDLDNINMILYASPGKEQFYEKLGFQLGKTCMLRFQNPEIMELKGFI